MKINVIKDKCWEKRTTVAGLERAIGLSNGTIAKWQTSSPRVDNLKKVADFLGCTVDELLAEGGDGDAERA